MDKITTSQNARGQEYEKILNDLQNRGICNFCQGAHFLEGHGKPVLLEGKHWIVTENFQPYENAVAHLLLIYRNHVNTVTEVEDGALDELRDLFLQLSSRYDISGSTLIIRSGESGKTGSTVTHLHAQIISGNGKDPVITRVG